MLKQWDVGILLFNEIEVMDFAGPFEVFSLAAYSECDIKPFNVKTVSETKDIINARNGLKIQADYCFENAQHFDILIIPGGYGAEETELKNQNILGWIRERMSEVEIIVSVCTGAFLLAEAGLLNGKKATTHWMDIDRLEREYSKINVVRNVKFVDEEQIISSGGMTAGIDMSLYLIKKLLNADIAKTVAKRLEYACSYL